MYYLLGLAAFACMVGVKMVIYKATTIHKAHVRTCIQQLQTQYGNDSEQRFLFSICSTELLIPCPFPIPNQFLCAILFPLNCWTGVWYS